MLFADYAAAAADATATAASCFSRRASLRYAAAVDAVLRLLFFATLMECTAHCQQSRHAADTLRLRHFLA